MTRLLLSGWRERSVLADDDKRGPAVGGSFFLRSSCMASCIAPSRASAPRGGAAGAPHSSRAARSASRRIRWGGCRPGARTGRRTDRRIPRRAKTARAGGPAACPRRLASPRALSARSESAPPKHCMLSRPIPIKGRPKVCAALLPARRKRRGGGFALSYPVRQHPPAMSAT